MKTECGCGPFGIPDGGPVTLDTPDGVVTADNDSGHSSLTNAHYARGGPDGGGYGAFGGHSAGFGIMIDGAPYTDRSSSVTNITGPAPKGRFRID